MFGIIGLAVLSGLGHRYSHPARMLAFVNFQPIPDAESLPFHLLVLKLVVCEVWAANQYVFTPKCQLEH